MNGSDTTLIGVAIVSSLLGIALFRVHVKLVDASIERRGLLARWRATEEGSVEGNGGDRYLAARKYVATHATIKPSVWDRAGMVVQVLWIIGLLIWARSSSGENSEAFGLPLSEPGFRSGITGFAVVVTVVGFSAAFQELRSRMVDPRGRRSWASSIRQSVPLGIVAALIPVVCGVAWLTSVGVRHMSLVIRSLFDSTPAGVVESHDD